MSQKEPINKVYVPKIRRAHIYRLNKDGGPCVPADKILEYVEGYFGVTRESLIKVSRKREIVYPRQMAMYMLAYYSFLSLKSIGVIFSKDHTTVIHAMETIDDLSATDEKVKEQVNLLSTKIRNYGQGGCETDSSGNTTYPGHA